MADDQNDGRKDYHKGPPPWTKLFSAFKIALDPRKLLLAGAGLLVMSVGWYVLAIIFFGSYSNKPEWKDFKDRLEPGASDEARDAVWKDFKRARHRWYLLYEMAGTPPVVEKEVEGKKEKVHEVRYVKEDATDAAIKRGDSLDEFLNKVKNPNADATTPPIYKPYGLLRTMPWFEDRGRNPYLLAKDYIALGELPVGDGTRGFTGWLLHDQVPVLLEPLFKFFRPIGYLFDAEAGFLNRLYLLLVILWSLATWAFFGGAITRIASVQIARSNERVSLKEAVKFVGARYKSYLTAPLIPLLFLFGLAFVLFIFGLFETYLFGLGDVVGTLLWPIALLIGLVMAVVVVGLVGWPLMYSTISAEGSDSFDAISRSYSYVYQAPWQYIWYGLVALAYGAALVFFVGFMGSLLVYMAKWGVTLAPSTASREPSYLFQYAPTSFGWRELLLQNSPNVKTDFEVTGLGKPRYPTEVKFDEKTYSDAPSNKIGAFILSVWLYLLFLLVIGFGYSYFWTASTIIYMLMRQKVDETPMDEIHLEEEPEQPFPPPAPAPAPAAADAPKTAPAPLQMVDSPQLRPPAPAPAEEPKPPV